MILIEKAPAKINLALDVLHKRPDGYHEVEMVMTTIDLADRIQLKTTRQREIRITSHTNYIPNDHRNLAYQAAQLLMQRYPVSEGVEISIDKQIPIAAGLAGGSSDAAATLRGLNKLWNLGLSMDELAILGAEIGSDVSFCVYGGTALATGRGEIIKKLPAPPNCWVVLAKPKLGVSTADVYRRFDVNKAEHPDVQGLIQSLYRKDYHEMCGLMGNVLESVTLKKYPEVAHIKEQIQSFGADVVLMSGSGPTVFALVEHESRMHRLYNALMGFCEQIFTVRIIGNRPDE